MLHVAVTGPVGSGKTTLLLNLADEMSGVDGFVQLAGPRSDPNRGADSYSLKFVRRVEPLPFLSRTAEGYQFAAPALEARDSWAKSTNAEIVVLDEFGKWEAEGGGHMDIWPAIVAAGPSVVVISVRQDALTQIEAQLGRPFDVVIDVTEPDPGTRLREVLSQLRDWERVGVYGTGAGGIEASVGSAFHTFKFPLTGLVMSSTQMVVMSIAAEKLQRRERVVWVSMISAGLKALSPSGSRLGPMLAITVQGILGTAAYRVLGWNRVGAFAAGALACAWAGLQGLLIQYLLLGGNLQKAFDAVAKWVRDTLHVPTPGLIACVVAVAAVYALIGGSVTTWAWGRRNKLEARVDAAIHKSSGKIAQRVHKPFWKSVLDLFRPSFLLPTLIVGAILFAAGGNLSDLAWIALRTFAVGLALLGVVKWIDPIGFVRWMKKRGKWGPAYAFSRIFR